MAKNNMPMPVPSSKGKSGAKIVMNRNRGMDMQGHGREGNIGGMTNGPDFMPSGIESESRQPC